jgi:hypothetical protein
LHWQPIMGMPIEVPVPKNVTCNNILCFLIINTRNFL